MGLDTVSITSITIICYGLGIIAKSYPKFNNRYIPALCGFFGAILGIVGLYIVPDFPATDLITALAIGISSGLAATGVNQAVVKQSKKND